MKNLESAKELIKKHEGLRLAPYKCSAGKLTIGWGRNLEDNGITTEEAEMMLNHDLQLCIASANRFDWFDALDEVRQSVVVNMIFNLGLAGFSKFKKTIAAIEKGDFDEASKEMLDSLWARQVKGRAQELANMMKEGKNVGNA